MKPFLTLLLLFYSSSYLLQAGFRVTLVDPKDRFYQCFGSVRAVSSKEGFEDSIMIPYDRLFKKKTNTVIQAYCVDIDGAAKTITLKHSSEDKKDSKETTVLGYDYLILGIGSDYPIWQSASNSHAEFKKLLLSIRESFAASKSCTIVGGGAVGLEAAGELKHNMPHLDVTIVSSPEHLLANDKQLIPLMRRLCLEDAKKAGIKVILNTKVDNVKDIASRDDVETIAQGWYKGKGGNPITLSLTNNADKKTEEHSANIVLITVGGSPNTAFLKNTKVPLDSHGCIEVTPTYQVRGFDSIFALGDSAASGEPRLAFVAKMQSEIVVKNIVASVNKSALKSGPVHLLPIGIVPIGPKFGWGQLPGIFRPNVIRAIAGFKSKDYLVSMIYPQLNYTMKDTQEANKPPSGVVIRNPTNSVVAVAAAEAEVAK